MLLVSIKTLLPCLLLILASNGNSHPISAPGGFPEAAMNRDGDFIMVGSKKIIWGHGHHIRAQAIEGGPTFIYSAAIAPRAAQSSYIGIVCTKSQVWLFSHLESPPEIWSKDSTPDPMKKCHMDTKGNWLVASPAAGQVWFNGTPVMNIANHRVFLGHNNQGPWLLDTKGQLTQLDHGGTTIDIRDTNLKPTIYSAVKSNSHQLVVAHDDGVKTFSFAQGSTRSLAANPCNPQQICGLSIAPDDSILITGYWGGFLITPDTPNSPTINRWPLPTFPGEYGRPAIAHSSSNGVFAYVGLDDGDIGELSETKTNPLKQSQPLPTPTTAQSTLLKSPWWARHLKRDQIHQKIKDKGLTLTPVTVGAIDTGIATHHPLLENRTKAGYDFVEEDPSPNDDHGHGTHVATLIAGGSPKASFSLAPNTTLVMAKALDGRGRSNSIDLARAMHYLLDQRVALINCSWGGGSDTQILRQAFQRAKREGVIVFTSAGNDNLNNDVSPPVPSRYSHVVSVGGISRLGHKTRSSSFGKATVLLMAPGHNILGGSLDGGLSYMSGTSMASPIALSGAALSMGLKQTSSAKAIGFLCRSSKPNPRWSRCGSLTLDNLLF